LINLQEEINNNDEEKHEELTEGAISDCNEIYASNSVKCARVISIQRFVCFAEEDEEDARLLSALKSDADLDSDVNSLLFGCEVL
jgi:hypothetical protein